MPTILLATLLATCSLVASNRTSALTYQDNVDVQFTFNPVIRIDLSDSELLISNLAPGAAADSNIITVGASTNASAGYQLSATVGAKGGTDALVNSIDNTKTFANLASSKAALTNFDDNTWGYSYCADSATNCEAGGSASWVSGSVGSTANGYAGLPLDDNDDAASRGLGGVTLISTDGSNNDSVVQFKIGAKAGANQVAGTYNNTINFYAVANPSPKSFNEAYADAGKEMLNGYYKMQDITSEICSAVDDLQTGTLIDVRDYNTYTVAKLAGACWMTQNLRITGTIDKQYSNFDTYDEVNVCENDLSAGISFDEPRCHNSGNTNNGVWYNYAATSAKTVVGTSTAMDATEDICPTGWHLPNVDSAQPAGSINSLVGIDAPSMATFNPVAGGGYSNDSPTDLDKGYWWASTASTILTHHVLRYSDNSLALAPYGRGGGLYIRCVK